MGFVLAPLMRSMRFTNPAGSWGIWATPWQWGIVYWLTLKKRVARDTAAKLRKCASRNRYLQAKYSWTRLGIVGRRRGYSRLGSRLVVRPFALFFLFGRHIFWRSRAASRCALFLFLSSFALCYIYRFDRKEIPQARVVPDTRRPCCVWRFASHRIVSYYIIDTCVYAPERYAVRWCPLFFKFHMDNMWMTERMTGSETDRDSESRGYLESWSICREQSWRRSLVHVEIRLQKFPNYPVVSTVPEYTFK